MKCSTEIGKLVDVLKGDRGSWVIDLAVDALC